MSTTTPRPPTPWLLQAPEIGDLPALRWFERLPGWLSTGAILVVLMAVSAILRTRYISGQLWAGEGAAVGVAVHPFGAIPGVLRHDGSTPLYYLVLHLWMSALGSSESAVHALSLLFGLASIPLAMWTGSSLFGRRAGLLAATLFATSAFFTQYAEESQPYELVALLGLLATAGFLHGFVFGRRRYVIGFAVCLALLLYASFWAIFFWAGAALALIPVSRAHEDTRRLHRDALLAFGAGLVLFLPWVPNLLFQMAHDTNPFTYAAFTGPTFPSSLLGGDRVLAALAIPAAAGLLPMLSRAQRRTPEGVALWALLVIALGALVVAAAGALAAPTWITRYFAPVVAPMLLLAAFTAARTGVLGLAAVVISIAFVANPASFSAKYKSDVRDVAGELAPVLRPGDTVLVAAPEQTPLAWYYLPAGLRYATTMGRVRDPSYVDWTDAYARLGATAPGPAESALVAGMAPGSHLLFLRPLTEGATAWSASWSGLVRRRAAQWGALLSADPRLRAIPGAVAPHNYRGACCVGDSALVYTRAS